ncbi:transcriptional regulator BetI [bacterium YEK0313]|nr:transcriptional regulator BetI [bacterium YEK0313]
MPQVTAVPAPITPDRRDDVLDAALALLTEGGLKAVTTAAIARAARCSKDTLYLLFEDRDAILAALVQRQAAALNAALAASAAAATPPEALVAEGASLAALLTGEASLVINRAALADDSGRLSQILIAAGRDSSAPGLVALIAAMRDAGDIAVSDLAEAYATFFGLLVGDRQILALHRVPAAEADHDAVARRAVERFVRIYGEAGVSRADASPASGRA